MRGNQCRLFGQEKEWIKKGTGLFNVTMGCQVQSVVYRATVETVDCRKDYTGLTALTFKERFNGHQHSMQHRGHKNSTTASRRAFCLWRTKASDSLSNMHLTLHPFKEVIEELNGMMWSLEVCQLLIFKNTPVLLHDFQISQGQSLKVARLDLTKPCFAYVRGHAARVHTSADSPNRTHSRSLSLVVYCGSFGESVKSWRTLKSLSWELVES